MRPVIVRLVLLNDAAAWRRFAGTAAGIGIGVALLLTLLGANSALNERHIRTGWMSPDPTTSVHSSGKPIPMTDKNVLMSPHQEVFRGDVIQQIDIALTPDSQVRLPGGLATPPPGQSLVSPALARLIAATPPDQLGDRFGVVAAELPASVLAGPDSLVVIHITTEEALRDRNWLFRVDRMPGEADPYGTMRVYSMLLVIGAIALMIPVVLLVSIVTQLGAAQRRERLQTLRLIGATPGTVAGMAAAEMALTTTAGGLAGLALFYLARPLAAQVQVDMSRFYTTDLSLAPWRMALVIVLVVAVSAATAAWRVNKEGIGPVGVTKQRAERVPGVVRLLPLAAGLAVILGDAFTHLVPDAVRQYVAIASFGVLSAGIIVAGPWLVHRVSGILARHTRSGSSVVAMGCFRRHPVAAFRSVAGLVVALFLVSFFSGMASVANLNLRLTEVPGLMTERTAMAQLAPGTETGPLSEKLLRISGVTGVIVGYISQESHLDAPEIIVSAADAASLGITGLADDGCVAFDFTIFADPNATHAAYAETIACPDEAEAVGVFVLTDGTRDAMERAKTWLATNATAASSLTTRGDLMITQNMEALETLATMAYLGVFIAIVIAGISLAVSSAGAVIDNKRTFGFMGLMGMPPSVLRKVTVTQAIVPLVSTIGATIVTGFGVAWALLEGWGQEGMKMTWPDPRYYVAVAVGLVIAGIAVVSTFPVIAGTTRTESTRFE